MSISSLGTHYVIGLNAVDCRTGDELTSEQVEADGREHVLQALDERATKMRRQLGESLNSIHGSDWPIYKASTTSLEALKAFSLAQKIWSTQGDNAALPLYKRALELDPGFAMAYAHLENTYENLGVFALQQDTGKSRAAYRDFFSVWADADADSPILEQAKAEYAKLH